MSFAIYQDMQEVLENPDKWINHGRNVLENNCKHKTQDKDNKKDNRETNIRYSGYCEKCDVSEDSAIPMMNFLYPLELDNFDEDKILKVVKETNCTILENQDTEKWFLVLCGGGMDLSQDIVYAYLILEKWIPFDLLREVISQKEFSINKNNYQELKKAILEQAEHYKSFCDEIINRWNSEK